MKKIIFLLFMMTGLISLAQEEKVREYYDSGTLQSYIEYKDGKRNGQCIHYWKNGELWGSGTYKMGIQDGEWKTYYENGALKQVTHYKDGKFVGESRFFSSDGRLERKTTYDKDGTAHWEFYDKDGNIVDSGANDGC